MRSENEAKGEMAPKMYGVEAIYSVRSVTGMTAGVTEAQGFLETAGPSDSTRAAARRMIDPLGIPNTKPKPLRLTRGIPIQSHMNKAWAASVRPHRPKVAASSRLQSPLQLTYANVLTTQ